MSRSADVTTWALTRASGVDMNPTQVTTRANQFATKTTGFDSTVLLLRREEDTMRGYLLTTGHGGDSLRAATDLAHTIGARAVEAEAPEDLDVDNVVGWLVYESGSAVAREAQVNADPTETARLLANTLPPGSWVAVTMRKPSKRERSRNQAWLSHRLSTAVPNHHSLSPDAVVVSIYAGAPDAGSVRHLLEAARSAMPGFDVITKTKVATRIGALITPLAVAGMTAAAGAASTYLAPDSFPGSLVPDVAGPGLLLPALGLAALAVVVGVLRFVGVLGSPWKRTQAAAASAIFDAPAKRRGRPRAPRKESTRGDKHVEARDGDYPLHPAVFQVGPQVVVGVVAPQAGAVSGESETRARDVPPVMLRRIGPMIGDSAQGPAYLSAADAFGGLAVVGKAGSGKSLLVRSLFGWACLERVAPTGVPGFPGAANALIAFESKGDGVAQYQAWADATGDTMVAINVADPTSFAIDVFAVPGTVQERANFFVNALVYAFGDGAIGDRSFETLLSLLPAALLVTPEIASRVPDISPHGSPIYYTHVLLGGRGDDPARALASELAHESVRDGADPALREAVVGMGPLFGSATTAAARRTLSEAPRNKLRQLIELESWWSPARRKVTWAQVLDKHRAVVINTGTTTDGRMVENELNGQMSAILMFSLRHAIQRHCSGWEDQGRSVSIFADELSLLAGSSEAVVAWLKDQGRSFGVRTFLATQRPEQLPQRVRSAFMNFSTLVSYMQEDMTTAREIAEGVSGEEGEWTAADVLGLNTYTAVVRAHVGKKRQPAFTVRVRNFEADRAAFAETQGYLGSTPSGPVPSGVLLAKPPTPGAVPGGAHGAVPGTPDPAEQPVLADPVPIFRPVAPAGDEDEVSPYDLMG